MNQRGLHPPRAPPDHLRLQSFQILSRLELIHEFRLWLDFTRYHVPRKRRTSLELLWDCFSFGAPLGTLLNLLGSPSPSHLVENVERFNFGIGIEEREAYFTSFIQRVQLLEMQGRLAYGEVLRSDDFLNGASTTFAKVLRTVYRLLVALQESYPGLFVVPSKLLTRRYELIRKLVDTEQAHISILKAVTNAAMSLSEGLNCMEPWLECFLVNRDRLVQYHEDLLKSVQDITSQTVPVRWNRIFALDDDMTRTKIFGAYRCICINYLSLVEFLETLKFKPILVDHTQVIIDNLSILLSRILNYNNILQDILDTTSPAEDQGYNTLCEAVFRMGDISETMEEAGSQLRTMRSVQILRGRAYIWTAPDPADLGLILLDDCVTVNPTNDITYSVFFFETLLLCCTEGFDGLERKHYVPHYPIHPWEMGPALRQSTPLDIVHAIPTSQLECVSCSDITHIEITWVDDNYEMRMLNFYSMAFPQWDQWVSTLQTFVPPIYRPPTVPHVILGEDEDLLSDDEDPNGKRILHARPWSVVARKGPRSESSSFIVQERNDDEFPLSPGVLQTLFDPEILRSPSPLSSMDAVLTDDRPPTPPMDDGFGPFTNPSALHDLTGKITREGRYPCAHGGFSDVWKGVWHNRDCEHKVAVKVLRSRIGDPEVEEKMIRRLRRELSIWKNLSHPHILNLYGTASDFGHYTAMVCPWMENGNVSKYMDRCGDIMSTNDRLKILCEVADGLSYLHSRSIIHGDLTGSNILLTDSGQVRLCDFGLSSIVAEFQGTDYFTSTIGGAVRWTDALLYRINTEEEGRPPTINKWNDIYSFGSVMLEVLSGRIPYHYIRTDAQVVIELHKGNKPRRPAQSFVSDSQWSLIECCWADDADQRPNIKEVCVIMQALYDKG